MYNAYPSVASTSLSASGTIAEEYVPLFVYSSTYIGASSITTAGSGNSFLQKGSGGFGTSSATPSKLYTLSSNWSSSQKFAFEASIEVAGSTTAYAGLWDITSGALVSGSQISTTSTTMILIRSGSFTLTPGHTYGVCVWQGATSCTTYLTKAHLVALEM